MCLHMSISFSLIFQASVNKVFSQVEVEEEEDCPVRLPTCLAVVCHAKPQPCPEPPVNRGTPA